MAGGLAPVVLSTHTALVAFVTLHATPAANAAEAPSATKAAKRAEVRIFSMGFIYLILPAREALRCKLQLDVQLPEQLPSLLSYLVENYRCFNVKKNTGVKEPDKSLRHSKKHLKIMY